MNNLRLTIVQSDIKWHNRDANLANYSKMLQKIRHGATDIIVLPEMFNTGFSMEAKQLAEQVGGVTMQWMAEHSSLYEAVVCGSIIIKDGKQFYNRFIWMLPDGTYEYYDKRHLFSMAKEDKTFTKGTESVLFEYKGWKICPQVCYDLRFPVWSRNRAVKNGKTTTAEFDLLLYVANWPAVRSFAWRHLLIARAIENQCYVAGVNRIGNDGNNIEYKGESVVIDCLGEQVSKTKSAAGVETIILDAKKLEEWRKKFPVLLDADEFSIS